MGFGTARVVTCFANRKTDGFDSHKVHQWDIKCVITLAVGYLVASLKPPINGGVAPIGRASALHAEGCGFESHHLHQIKTVQQIITKHFFGNVFPVLSLSACGGIGRRASLRS